MLTGMRRVKPKKKKRHHHGVNSKEYQRRQHTYRWLETHVWHAKRMRMQRMYGYKLVRNSYSPSLPLLVLSECITLRPIIQTKNVFARRIATLRLGVRSMMRHM